MTANNLLPADGSVLYYPRFFSPAESDSFLQNLMTIIPWRHDPIQIFGKVVLQPRLTAYFGDAAKPYTYSGITMQPLEWTPDILSIKAKVESFAQVTYSGVLVNFYRDQKDSMGWHSDDEKELGQNPKIASVSFGADRELQFRKIQNKRQKISVTLEHGSLLLMEGTTQHFWQHQIPKRTRPIAPRINLTFRQLL